MLIPRIKLIQDWIVAEKHIEYGWLMATGCLKKTVRHPDKDLTGVFAFFEVFPFVFWVKLSELQTARGQL